MDRSLSNALTDRIAEVHTDEDGAQAVEYAMIGGMGAGLISLLWAIFTKTNVLDRLLDAVVTGMTEAIKGWF